MAHDESAPRTRADREPRSIVWFVLLRIPELFLAMLVAILVVFLTASVISRYVLDVGLTWSDEAARLLFVWIVFVGFAVGVRHRGHIAVEWFVDQLPRKWRPRVSLFRDVAILVFSLVFTWQSIIIVRFSFRQELPGLQISIAWLYFSVLVAAVLMTIYACANLWEAIRGKAVDPDDTDADSAGHAL